MTVEQAISYLMLVKDKTEPVFVLRGQDNIAPNVIQYWAETARACGVSEGKVWGALEIRKACLAWPKRKFPD